MADIFKCKEEMPSKDMSADVVRVALTTAEARYNESPATSPDPSKGVKSVTRPRYGHGY